MYVLKFVVFLNWASLPQHNMVSYSQLCCIFCGTCPFSLTSTLTLSVLSSVEAVCQQLLPSQFPMLEIPFMECFTHQASSHAFWSPLWISLAEILSFMRSLIQQLLCTNEEWSCDWDDGHHLTFKNGMTDDNLFYITCSSTANSLLVIIQCSLLLVLTTYTCTRTLLFHH